MAGASRKRIEWPTIVVAIGATFVWVVAVHAWGVLGWWWLVPVVVMALTLHSSCQHEALHGHPTRSRLINEALVFLPIGLAYPYRRFRALHLQHHHDELLTDPFEDPESAYLSPDDWAKAGPLLRRIRTFNNTALGRLLIGPYFSVVGFARAEIACVRSGDRGVRLAWLLHLAGMVPMFWWVSWVCGIDPLVYIFCAAYPGLSMLSIRTFIEHQAREQAPERSIINEDRGLLAFLFLNNSLHFVHHRFPTVAWYLLPALYRGDRERFLAANGGYVARNYTEVFRRYGLKPKEPVEHPLMAKGRWRRGGSG